jgi:small-conductance mechanosensitive channel
MELFADLPLKELAKPVIRVILVLALALGVLWVTRLVIGRLRQRLIQGAPESEQSKRIVTGTRVLQSLVGGIVLILVLMEVLSEMGLHLGPLLAAAGIGGLAVGFGAQTLIKDLIGGFFLLLENQVRVGDVVSIGGNGGLVESMGFRTLTLRDQHGNVHIIPNGSVDRVINMTRDYSRYVFDTGVAYREDPDRVMAVIQQVGEEMLRDPDYAPDILEPLEMLGVDRFEDSAVIIRSRITTRPIKQWRVGREFNRRLKKAFDAAQIEIPYPHRTVYFGEPREGGAAPLRVVFPDVAGAPHGRAAEG